jgi:molybdate transport system substrate-binding protein
MKKTHLLLLILTVLGLTTCNNKSSDSITIASAANVQFAMQDLMLAFEKESGIRCTMVIGSSGKLTAQIKKGAPFDIFVSADMRYPNELFKSGFANEEPRIYALGSLVLMSINKSIQPSLDILESNTIKHIAIANPNTAPYGIAAKELLTYYNKYESLSNKLVFGESISQTNQFIYTSAVELGFTAKSSYLAFENTEAKSYLELDKESYRPINQGIILIVRKHQNIENAKKFYLFLFSEEGQAILIRNGYTLPNITM